MPPHSQYQTERDRVLCLCDPLIDDMDGVKYTRELLDVHIPHISERQTKVQYINHVSLTTPPNKTVFTEEYSSVAFYECFDNTQVRRAPLALVFQALSLSRPQYLALTRTTFQAAREEVPIVILTQRPVCCDRDHNSTLIL